MENKKAQHPRSKKKIAMIIIICILVIFFFIIMPILTRLIYLDNFGKRFETAQWMAYSVNEFDGLKVTESTFPSNNGQLLAGYHYSKENQEIKGISIS